MRPCLLSAINNLRRRTAAAHARDASPRPKCPALAGRRGTVRSALLCAASVVPSLVHALQANWCQLDSYFELEISGPITSMKPFQLLLWRPNFWKHVLMSMF